MNKPTNNQLYACYVIYRSINGIPISESEIRSEKMFIDSLSKDRASKYISENIKIYKENFDTSKNIPITLLEIPEWWDISFGQEEDEETGFDQSDFC